MTLLPILLPDESRVEVSVNDKLTAGQVIAKKGGVSTEEIIHVSQSLNIPLKKFKNCLKKNLGDSIEEGEIIAVKKGHLGIGGKKLISKFSGTVINIDEGKGDVYIKTGSGRKEEEIISPVDGTVDFCDNEKIVVKTDGEVVLAQDGLGNEQTGELLYIENFDPNKLTGKISGRVILTKNMDKASLFKAIGLNAAGVITCGLEDTDFIDLEDKRIDASVLILAQDNFNKLEKYKNKKVFLGGKNKIIVIL